METCDRDESAVGADVDRGDDGETGVGGRVGRVEVFFCIGGRVVLGAFGNPASNEGDFEFVERRLVFGHLGLSVLWRDLFEERAFGRISGNDGHSVFLSACEQFFEIGHHVTATRFGRLVTSLAVGLEDGPDVFVVADGF